ncbi:MAG: hypothetical protein JJU08_17780 [Rhodobacteraceae bacterium]|nr:hypothetical protein [Paracoccaceae bacterium]
MKRFTASDAQIQAVASESSDLKALKQGAVAEQRRAFLRDWLENRGRSISLLSAGGLIFLPLLGATSAQAQQGPVVVSTIDGVSNLAFNPDGSLQIALSNGQVVTIAAAEVTVMANGAVAISAAAAELVASLAGIGAAAVGTGTLAALAGGAAAAAAAAAGGGGGSDAAPSSSSSSPPPPVRGAGFASNADSPLAVNAGMVLSAQAFTGIAPADSVVRITLNDANGDPLLDGLGEPYVFQGTVDVDGTYTILLPAFDTLVPGDGDYQIVIQAFNDDGTGNPTGNPRGTQTVEITVDTEHPTISIDIPIIADDQLNIAASQTPLTLTGTTDAEDGTGVATVTLNGDTYTGNVSGGVWSVTIPSSALQILPDGALNIAIDVRDAAGNLASENTDPAFDPNDLTITIQVDLTPPTIGIIALPFGDFLNLDDTGTTQIIDGTSGGANGRTVTLTVTDANGAVTTFTETTDAVTGAWSIDLLTGTLAALAEGTATLSATVADSFNNPPASPATAQFTVDTIAPDVAITQIAGDGIINIPEQADGFTVSGTSNAEEGQLVTVLIDGVAAANTGAVDANGNWTVTILTADVTGLGNGDTPDFTARVQDQAGNETTSAAVPATVNLTEPTIAVTQIGGDGYINLAEQSEDGTIVTGTTNAEDGQDVVVTLTQGGTTETTTVQAGGGTFTAPFTPAQLAGFTDGAITATATVENAIGNTGTSAGLPGTVDLIAPTITINDPLAGDNQFTKLNEANGLDVTGTTDAEDGQFVTVTYNGTDYDSAPVAGGIWTANIPDTAFTDVDTGDTITGITARVSDQAGNLSDVATGPTLNVDLTGPSITINAIAVDDIINIAESADLNGVEISGIASGADGQTVTVVIRDASNDVVFTAPHTAASGTGAWSVTIPQGEAWLANDATFTISADVSDFESIAAPTATRGFTTDFNNPTIDIGTLPFGSFLNALDTESEQSISGTSSGANGQTVTLTVTDDDSVVHTFTGDTNATTGAWSIPIPTDILENLAEGTADLSATVNSAAGNPPSAPATATFTVDTEAPDITINEPPFLSGGDTFLNDAEAGTTQTITGTAPGAEAGQPVTLTITDSTGAAVTITPAPQVDGSENWTVDVDLSGLAEGAVTISAMVSDAAGNPADNAAELTFTKDTIAPDVAITQIAGDDIINIPEQADGFTVSGTSNAEEGQLVTVLIDGVAAANTGAVDANGNWTVTILTADVAGLANGDTPAFTARVQDQAGNETTSAAVPATVNLTPPTISFATLAGDDILNIAESNAAELTISGTTTGFADGDQITISADGISDIIVTVTGNEFTHNIARADVFALIEDATGAEPTLDVSGNLISAGAGAVTFTASGTNTIGNPSVDVTTDLTLALTPPELAIDDIEGTGGADLDGVINIDERAAGLEINGTSDANGQTVTVTLTDGNGFTATATDTVTGGTWQANFAAGSLNALPDGTTQISVTAEVTDANGNGTTTAPTTMPTDFIAPVVTIASVESGGAAIGDFINIDERDAGITVSGGSDLPENTTVTVTVTAAAFTAIATGTTDADGNWSVVFEGDGGAYDLELLPEGAVSIVASAGDAAANTGESTPVTPIADLTRPDIFIDPIGDEGVYDRSQGPLTLTGTTDAEAGQIVTVTFEGQTYTGTVVDGGGGLNTWALDTPIPSSALNALAPGTAFIASATVSDLAGNAVATPATIDVVPYSASDSYITEISRDGDDIRFGIYVELGSPLLTDAAYVLGDTLVFDTASIQYLSPAQASPFLQPDFNNQFGTLTFGTVILDDLAAGRIEFAAGWVENTTFGEVAVPNPEVARVTFTMRDLNAGSEILTLSLENDQGLVATTFIGTNGDDTLTATNTDTLIRGRGGDDTIDMSAGGVNTVIFEADPAANGVDTITGFSVAPDTALPDRIGFAGLDNATLRGDGTDFQALGIGGTLGTDTGFVVLTFDLGGLTAVDLATAAEGLVGEAGGDFIYLLATDGTNAALARVEYTAPDTANAEIMANFTGLGDLTGITANEILGFNTV